MASVLSGPCVCAAGSAAHLQQVRVWPPSSPRTKKIPLSFITPSNSLRVLPVCAHSSSRRRLPRPVVCCKRWNSRPGNDASSIFPRLLGFHPYLSKRAKLTLPSTPGSFSGRNVSPCVVPVPKHSNLYSGGQCYPSCRALVRNSRSRFQTTGVPECIPGIRKHKRELHWVLDLAEFWGIEGSRSGREVSSLAATSGEGQVELGEGASTQVLSASTDSSVVKDPNLGLEGVTKGVAATADKLIESHREESGTNWSSTEDSLTPTNAQTAAADSVRIGLEDPGFRRQLVMAADAGTALGMIADRDGGAIGGVVGTEQCSGLILDALAQGNGELAFSILDAMRSSLTHRRADQEGTGAGWQWTQPSVNTYATLVRGLAASLRVSDAIQIVADIRCRGVPAGDEVPFGKVVSCPTCKTALAVVQPQQGVQVAPCAKCRYQYELMSGTVLNCESESVSMNISAFERGLRVLKLIKRPVPSAVHSLVVCAPDGIARTHRCATESADIPAQEGERVTVVSAAPANAGLGLGPFKLSARTPGWRPSEPMAITNHVTSRVSPLSRPPPKSGSGAAFDTSFIVPAALLLASSDAAMALIDPALPRAIAIGAAAAVALGGATNTFVLPRLNQLPQRTVDALALRQQLLAQHESLQGRLQNLTQAAADDVRMLARMCQLQNKMEAVGEPNYSARLERVRKARESLDERLEARLKLIDSYAKIASMIEIEVEMDVDVLAAEGAGAAALGEQIERLMEVEDLQKAWKLQAEANDEVERLLRSVPMFNEPA